ncbi:MAG: STAS domain-containing protein, partial [Bacteroidia bacterium]|nr:STAS domain-containing protein [Bacteroidia bacterium]
AVVVVGTLAMYLFRLDGVGISIVRNIPEGFPKFAFPSAGWDQLQQVFPAALTLALIGFSEAITIGKVMQQRHKDYEIHPNQELVALGLANMGGSLFQSYPATAGFSRTAVNDQAGARSGVASLFSALVIALTLLFLTPWFYFLPKAVLASIIMVAVINLIDLRYPRFLWQTQREELLMWGASVAVTLMAGIWEGLLIGVALSLVVMIYQTTRPHVAELGQFPGTNEYRNITRFDEVETRADVLVVRYDASLYFANLRHFQETMEGLIRKKGKALRLLVLNSESINGVDASALEMLRDWVDDLRASGIILYLSGVKGPVRDSLYRAGLIKRIGEDHFFLDVQPAIDYYDNKKEDWPAQFQAYAIQTNAKGGLDSPLLPRPQQEKKPEK